MYGSCIPLHEEDDRFFGIDNSNNLCDDWRFDFDLDLDLDLDFGFDIIIGSSGVDGSPK